MKKTFCDWCNNQIPDDGKVHRITENHSIKNESTFMTDWGKMEMHQEFGGDSLNEPSLELCDECGTIRANVLANSREMIHELKKQLRPKIAEAKKKGSKPDESSI